MGNCSSKPKGSPRKGRKSGGTGRAAFSAVIPVLIGREGSVETLVEAVVEGAVEAVVVDAGQAVPDVGKAVVPNVGQVENEAVVVDVGP